MLVLWIKTALKSHYFNMSENIIRKHVRFLPAHMLLNKDHTRVNSFIKQKDFNSITGEQIHAITSK
jgi:hypothetical protein